MTQWIEKIKSHSLWLIFALIISILILVSLTIYTVNLNRDLNNSSDEISTLNKSIEELNLNNDTLKSEKESLIGQLAQSASDYEAQISELKTQLNALEGNNYHYPDYLVSQFNSNGFSDIQQFLNTLTDHPELIPTEGILGGTMRWYPEMSIVLDDKFVYAYFEDGHISGHAILQYKLLGNSEVEWQTSQTFMD
ncbi:MAG: hypothetical protein BGO41_13465 [Clostridiales bacterium 38-18]|nr:MAG: hypothetical protein BGO41_13465 [Clostridiales bacterium 38-18]